MAPEIISHNFQFLTAYDRQFVRLATLAERYFRSDPNTSLIKLRQFGELLAQEIAARVGLFTSQDEPQADPLLLDPVCWGDARLLAFKADGEPTCAVPANELAVRRVRETVSALGLDSPILCEARREKWRNCETKLKKFRDIVEVNRQRQNMDAAAFSRDLYRDIAALFDDRAEFTATGKACAAELEADELVTLARALSQRALEDKPETVSS